MSSPAKTSVPDLVMQDDFIPRESVDLLLANLSKLRHARDSLFYVPMFENLGVEREKELDQYFGEGVGRIILTHLAKTVAILGPQRYAEIFFRVSDGLGTNNYGRQPEGRGRFHRDTSGWLDPARRIAPIATRSTVTYLSPSVPLPDGGSTYIFFDRTEEVLARTPEWLTVDEATALSPSYVRVPLKVGRTAMFPGDCPHMVAPLPELPEGVARVTFLVNFWDDPPHVPENWLGNPGGINPMLTPKQYATLGRLGADAYPFLASFLPRIRSIDPAHRAEVLKLLHAWIENRVPAAWPFGLGNDE